jgi:Ca2+:H+ antiporter
VIIAIACWYYPNPDVATSNSLKGSVVNVPMTIETFAQLQKVLDQYHGGSLLA